MGWDGQEANLVEQRFAEYAEDTHYLQSLVERLSILEDSSSCEGAVSDQEGIRDFLSSEIARYRMRITPVESLLTYLDSSEPELARYFHLRYVEKRNREQIRNATGQSDKLQRQFRKRLLRKGQRFIGEIFLKRNCPAEDEEQYISISF
jgi:hypothetical protein